MSLESPHSYPNNRGENWISYRESESFKEGIKQLEEIDGLVSANRALVLAVALNLKQAAVVDLDMERTSPETFERTLSELGVYFYRDLPMERRMYVQNFKDEKYEDVPIAWYTIGASSDAIGQAMEESRRFAEEVIDHRKFGEAMDFPPTAVDAWEQFVRTRDKKKLLDIDDEQLTDEERAFTFFRLSKDNWEEEIRWVEQIIAAVKMYSPAIYDQIITEYEKRKKAAEAA